MARALDLDDTQFFLFLKGVGGPERGTASLLIDRSPLKN
jgi:hypothetical protein